jgi:N1221-like protein
MPRAEDSQVADADVPLFQDELHNVTTILYILVESARNDLEGLVATQKELRSLNPYLVNYLVTVTAKLRWDDNNELPQTRVSLYQYSLVNRS